MQIQGQINSVKQLRSGSSNINGKTVPWTLYEVIINGQPFKTFEGAFANMVGQSGNYEYETKSRESNGKTYTDNMLSNLNKKPSLGPALKEINDKLDRILKAVENPFPEASNDVQPPQDEDINVEDIPF